MKLRSMEKDKPTKDGIYWVVWKRKPSHLLTLVNGEWDMTDWPMNISEYTWIDFEFEEKPKQDQPILRGIYDEPNKDCICTGSIFCNYLKTKYPMLINSAMYDKEKDEVYIRTQDDVYKVLSFVANACDDKRLTFGSIRIYDEDTAEVMTCMYK